MTAKNGAHNSAYIYGLLKSKFLATGIMYSHSRFAGEYGQKTCFYHAKIALPPSL